MGAGALLPLGARLLLGVRLRAGLLADGEAPTDSGLVDPGAGTYEALSGVVRLRPFADDRDVRRGPGLFLEASGGGTITGKDVVRAQVGAGIGYGVGLGSVGLSPLFRYQQVLQTSDALSEEDARLLMFGLELMLFDARSLPPKPVPKVKPPRDSDGDGLIDKDDGCPLVAEDADGFQDEDGCPEPDNDGDEILDPEDQCPDVAEDRDSFQDEDGCPEIDNDGDGFDDADDQCPNEAEVVNGNQDYDGCPDAGLIQMHNDRIVLEERVLFDFERARVKSSARPILHAIVHLFEQHPEWIKIRIEGHADTRGAEEYNQSLSQRRADHVRALLVRYGIPADVIEAIGFGAARPRDLRDEPEAHRRNRRVEFVVVARSTAKAEQTPAEQDVSAGEGASEGSASEPAEAEALPAQAPAADEPAPVESPGPAAPVESPVPAAPEAEETP